MVGPPYARTSRHAFCIESPWRRGRRTGSRTNLQRSTLSPSQAPLFFTHISVPPAAKLGIAQQPRKRRLYEAIQDSLLSDPNLISPATSVRQIAPAPRPSKSQASFNDPNKAPRHFSSALLLGTIHRSFIRRHDIQGQRQLRPRVSSNQDVLINDPDSLHIPGNDLFEGDPILVEDSPSCVRVKTAASTSAC